MMFSLHVDMIYENSALRDIFVKLLFIEYRLSKKKRPQPLNPAPTTLQKGWIGPRTLKTAPRALIRRTQDETNRIRSKCNFNISFFPKEAKYTLSYKFLIYWFSSSHVKIDVCPGDDPQTCYPQNVQRVRQSKLIQTSRTEPDIVLFISKFGLSREKFDFWPRRN